MQINNAQTTENQKEYLALRFLNFLSVSVVLIFIFSSSSFIKLSTSEVALLPPTPNAPHNYPFQMLCLIVPI